MITQEELSGMSDFDINKLVAKLSGIEFWTSSRHVIPNSQIRGDTLDYCNNPSDIMPIAFESFIGVDPVSNGRDFMAYIYSSDRRTYKYFSINKNPLRAICEVFILMNQK